MSVERLRVLARAVPGAAYDELVIGRDYAATWSFFEDLEHSVPQFEHSVDRVRRADIGGRPGLVVSSHVGPLRLHLRMDLELRDGLCLMQSRWYVVGMAAEPEGDATRFALFEAVRAPAPLARLVAWFRRGHVRRDLAGIARCVTGHPGPSGR